MKKAINFWWCTRPKRKLDAVPLILSQVVSTFLNAKWSGDRKTHLRFESALEALDLKRTGTRRDQTGGGARTYIAWLKSLGLLFEDQERNLHVTLAGEALLNNKSPVEILKAQVLKYQFPSSFSTKNSPVDLRFKVHPFVFLLKLLIDPAIGYLTQEEIAKVVIVLAENDSDKCLDFVKSKILAFRQNGDLSLEPNFFDKYNEGRDNFNRLNDTANTFINWLEFTRLAFRVSDSKLVLLEPALNEVKKILSTEYKLIKDWDDEEKFQRKYGLDPWHSKDTRNLSNTKTITSDLINEMAVKNQFIALSSQNLILKIDHTIIEQISKACSLESEIVAKHLQKLYPQGGIRQFMPKLYDLAFSGRDKATEFEKATVTIFQDEFKFKAQHVGSIGLTPDVLVLSDREGYCGIIDNKAYSQYTISNDHHNRMVYNYIRDLDHYYKGTLPLRFFSYIAGGFGKNINSQLQKITAETAISGSALSVENLILLIEKNRQSPISHQEFGKLFSCGHLISSKEIE